MPMKSVNLSQLIGRSQSLTKYDAISPPTILTLNAKCYLTAFKVKNGFFRNGSELKG